MPEPDYIYSFTDITKKPTPVRMLDNIQDRQYTPLVGINDHSFLHRWRKEMPSILADLIDLAVAIYAADWFSFRKQNSITNLHVKLPLRNPARFESISDELKGILRWYTGDNWTFSFTSRRTYGRLAELQPLLSIYTDSQFKRKEVALWSGGLDSLAGLLNRLENEKSIKTYTLFGTGSNPFIHNVQREVTKCLPYENRINLLQVLIRFSNTNDIRKNKKVRSRGFTFILMGAVCAYLQNCSRLSIYENGIGAFNLPFRTSEVGLDHTRAVHPLSLIKMQDFISSVLRSEFFVQNPFLFWTKAEMCKVFSQDHEFLVAKTTTCDRPHRQPDQPRQCGYCSSCLLRKQSLSINSINDRTKYVLPDGRKTRQSDTLYYRAMQNQVDTLAAILNSKDTWYELLYAYPSLFDVTEELSESEGVARETVKRKVLDLLQTYVQEWRGFQPPFGTDNLITMKLPSAA